MAEWWKKEITERGDAASLADHMSVVANDGTDLQKVGFVFLGRVMLVELKVVR
jgi:hypothetical protein